jgi:hypothetical protein
VCPRPRLEQHGVLNNTVPPHGGVLPGVAELEGRHRVLGAGTRRDTKSRGIRSGYLWARERLRRERYSAPTVTVRAPVEVARTDPLRSVSI